MRLNFIFLLVICFCVGVSQLANGINRVAKKKRGGKNKEKFRVKGMYLIQMDQKRQLERLSLSRFTSKSEKE